MGFGRVVDIEQVSDGKHDNEVKKDSRRKLRNLSTYWTFFEPNKAHVNDQFCVQTKAQCRAFDLTTTESKCLGQTGL
jgi:hypothetical protein